MRKFEKIYVITFYEFVTGGIELAHQLVDYLRRLDQDAYIVYIKDEHIVQNGIITEAYRDYNISVANNIEDKSCNILILPEVFFEFICQYKNINIGCWWMAVNTRYTNTSFIESFKFRTNLYDRLHLTLQYLWNHKSFQSNDNKFLHKEEKRIVHFYQSAYAQHHLYSKGFSKVLPLSDYVNVAFNEDTHTKGREDIILYNPRKGMSFTQKIINTMPHYKFVALKGYNRDELKRLFQTSKLYIDFGDFPGKDRLPREAILNGCCIITGTAGASFFYEDVAIPETYKIKAINKNIKVIRERIIYVLSHFEECVQDMNTYKNRIKKEKKLFQTEVEDFFV